MTTAVRIFMIVFMSVGGAAFIAADALIVYFAVVLSWRAVRSDRQRKASRRNPSNP